MPSLLPGFEYDIFISYRRKDNKYDGWVTQFVANLKKELEATFKEDVSIYFDENPHDGLLETHHVDKSLEGKLKCLIFIPVISQTYCDRKSFAWQQEFCAFNNLSKGDQFGRDIKLGNGNVASRILPVKIHNLDKDDQKALETETGSVLRAVEFIYKEPGVNRPLSPDDDPSENLNKTKYRNQVNKVANAVKELITSMKAGRPRQPGFKSEMQQPSRSMKATMGWAATVLIALSIVMYFLYPRWIADLDLDKSIAVLPFVDLSPNHDQEYFGDGMAEEIINVLAQVEGLKVISRSSSFQFKGQNQDLREVGDRLGVATVLEGSVRRSGDKLRITAQLIRASDGSHLWSKNYDRNPSDAIAVQDEIAAAIATALKATFSPAKMKPRETWDELAWKDYQMGRFYFDRYGDGDLPKAVDYFTKSLQRDSSHSIVWSYLAAASPAFYTDPDPVEVDRLNDKALQLDSLSGDAWIFKGLIAAWHKYSHHEALKYMAKALTCPENSRVLRGASSILNSVGKLDEAIMYGKRAIELDPVQPIAYAFLATGYFSKKQYDSSLLLARKGLDISPSGFPMYAILSLVMLKQWKEAEELIPRIADKELRLYFYCMLHSAQENRETSDRELAELKKIWEGKWNTYSDLAALYALRNETEPAIRYLQAAFSHRALWVSDRIKTSPMFDPLRKDPRFIEMIRQLDSE